MKRCVRNPTSVDKKFGFLVKKRGFSLHPSLKGYESLIKSFMRLGQEQHDYFIHTNTRMLLCVYIHVPSRGKNFFNNYLNVGMNL